MNLRRRPYIASAIALLAAPGVSFAQTPGKVWRIGFLNQGPPAMQSEAGAASGSVAIRRIGSFRRGLQDLGYVEGRNLLIEARYADNKVERLASMASELVQLKMDVIVAVTSAATAAARKASTSIPIVMVNAGDPVGLGFVASLARPGGNITGLTPTFGDLGPKYLELLLAVRPQAPRVAVLINPGNPAQAAFLQAIQAAAERIGVTILPFECRTPDDIDAAFAAMDRHKVGGVIVSADALYRQQQSQVAALAMKYRLPSVSGRREQVEAGFLISYGPNDDEAFRRAATYVDKILKGAKPGDMPVEQPMKYELFISGRTAKALGITIPQSLLLRADEVIQ